MTELLLNTDQATVGVRPALGGITRYRTGTGEAAIDWLVAGGPDGLGCFPLVPFCGRVREGRFEFNGRRVQLTPSDEAGLHAIHGYGLGPRWRLRQRTDSRVVLQMAAPGTDWPWPFIAEQCIELIGQDLLIMLTVSNTGDAPMPCGLGIHPYFPRSADMIVQAEVTGRWALDEEAMAQTFVPGTTALNDGYLLPEAAALDEVFGGWKGRATLTWPQADRSLHLSASDGPSNLVVYGPAQSNFVCVEPFTNTPNGFNLPYEPGRGIYDVVPAGASLRRSWRLQPCAAD